MPNFDPPDATEYAPAVANYVGLVPPGDLLQVLGQQAVELRRLVGSLSNEQALVHHAPYTWSIKQVVGHMIDCDRVFGYRTLCLARHDATPFPGFDEDAYMAAVDFDRVPLNELLDEYDALRSSHVAMLKHLSAEAWLWRGTVNHHPTSTRAVAFVMAGHTQHHLRILAKRLGR